MRLIRWRPTTDLFNIQDEINHMFDSYVGRENDGEASPECSWKPSVDITENKDRFVLYIELPGISRDAVKLGINDNILTISGDRKAPERDGNEFRRQERCHGKFERSFTLSQDLDIEKIEADLSDGVLSVRIPKLEEAKPKEIEVKIR